MALIITIYRGKVEVKKVSSINEYVEYLENEYQLGLLSPNWRHYIYNDDDVLIEIHYESILFNHEHELINYMN